MEQPIRASRLQLEGGGKVVIDVLPDGRFDLSVIAAEGPSAAAYLTRHELIALAGAARGLSIATVDLSALIGKPCSYEDGIPCDEEWPDEPVRWCSACFVRVTCDV